MEHVRRPEPFQPSIDKQSAELQFGLIDRCMRWLSDEDEEAEKVVPRIIHKRAEVMC